MWYFAMWAIFWGVIGSFGTAYLHERTGRDVRMGGIFGALIGAVGGIFLLTLFWIWLWYSSAPPVGRVYRPYNFRQRWFRWWEF